MLRFVLVFTMFFILSSSWAQEKYLFVEITPTQYSDDAAIKDYEVAVTTQEGISFEIEVTKKKASFYLPPGEKYTVEIIKEDFHTFFYAIDLRDVPEAMRENNKQELFLAPKLLSAKVDKPVPFVKYQYNNRYKKVVLSSLE